MHSADLRLDEANELLAAWVCARAESRGIRALVLKGRPLADDGLRRPRVSADVDLLVEPARFDDYCSLLEDAGWELFPETFASSHFTVHSRTFRAQGWPNSLDVHREYPGFLADPADVFELLWTQRREIDFAHRPCAVPSRTAGAVILALHSLRGTHKQPRHRAELDELASAEFTPDERAQIAALATASGAAGPLHAELARWGVDAVVEEASVRPDRALEWRRKTAEAEGAAASWLLLLRRARWRDKPRVVARALWPSRADFAFDHPEVAPGWRAQTRARVARWGRGFSRLPAALRALLRKG